MSWLLTSASGWVRNHAHLWRVHPFADLSTEEGLVPCPLSFSDSFFLLFLSMGPQTSLSPHRDPWRYRIATEQASVSAGGPQEMTGARPYNTTWWRSGRLEGALG